MHVKASVKFNKPFIVSHRLYLYVQFHYTNFIHG